jgi:hypothetical protein
MLKMLDGPARGQTIQCRRSPIFLRVVRNSKKEWDALDQLGDKPEYDEDIFVYVMVKYLGWIHLNTGGKPGGGMFMRAEYRAIKPQPTNSEVCDNDEWSSWCKANKGLVPKEIMEEMRKQREGQKS